MSSVPQLDVKESVAVLSLKVPPINALDEDALQNLTAALDEVENDESIKALVIASAIKGIFCTGGNLKYWPRVYPGDPEIVSKAGRVVFDRIEHFEKPSIAAINGHVIGDGLSLALACDIRIASPDSTFRLPELDYGFIPGWGTIGRLVELIGKPLTAELLLFGQEIAAERAQSIGLINRMVPADDLMEHALKMAKKAAGKPPLAMLHAKVALKNGLADTLQAREENELASFKAVWGNHEWREGIDKLFRKADAKS